MNNFTIKDIVAIILAGGKSKRFWPLTNKNLFNFTQGNLLDFHLKTLINLGIKNIIVICNPDVAAFLRVNSRNYHKIIIRRVLQDDKNHGIGRAILLAAEIIEKYYHNYPVYILNSDDVYDTNLHKALFEQASKKQTLIVMAAYKVSEYKPLGYFEIEKERVKGLIEKPTPNKIPSRFVNMALHLIFNFSKLKESLEEESLKSDENDDLYERAINRLCKTDNVSYVKYEGRWEILKYPWNVLDVSDFFLSKIEKKISDKAMIDKTARIEGKVVIEEGVKIMEFAVIRGPTVIKRNTLIGTGSLIRNSILGQDCVVGYHSEIVRSYVGNNCWFHTNYVGDSVLGNNVNLGSGAVLANLRLDQKNILSRTGKIKLDTGRVKLGTIAGNGVQIGVNASIMPGVKIGRNVIVGPGVILDEDLEDETKSFTIQQRSKVKNFKISNNANRKHFRELLK